MALRCALRITANASQKGWTLNNGRFVNPAIASTTVIPKKHFLVTPAYRKRILGPEEEHEKIDEIHHWKNERYVAVALLPIIPTALMFPNIWTDNLLVSAMLLHTYWRLSGVAEDYIHGEVLPKIAQPTVKILTVIALGGLFYFNYNDVGFANAVRKLYTTL